MAMGEGILAGIGAGSVFGGPVGALVGAGVGLLSRLNERNLLDAQAAEAALSEETDRRLQSALALANSAFVSPYDQMQAQIMGEQIGALRVAALSADPDTRREAQRGLMSYFPVISDELERVQGRAASVYDNEVSQIVKMTDEARKAYDGAFSAAKTAEATGQSIHQLLASDIPTDSPLLAGSVISLLQQSQRNMLVDPYGTSEYIKETLGSVPVIGGVLSGYMAGQAELAENTFSREDFRQIADAFLVGSRNAQAAAMAHAQARGEVIAEASAKIGYDPAVQVAAQLQSEVRTAGGLAGKGAYPDVEVRPVEGSPVLDNLPFLGGEPGEGPNPYGWTARAAEAARGFFGGGAQGAGAQGAVVGGAPAATAREDARAPLGPGEAWGGTPLTGKVARPTRRRKQPNRSRRMNQ